MPGQKKESPKDVAKSSKETSRQSYSVWVDGDLLAKLRAMTKEERRAVGEIIQRVRETFGRPHLHSGLGIRDLSPKGSKEGIYECRLNRGVRLVFTEEESSILYFHLMGSHNDVKRFLKAL